MSEIASPSLKQIALGDLEHEIDTTRKLLERVPEEHFAWKPHEKSYTLGELATHLANLLYWGTSIVRQDEYDFAATPPPRQVPASRAELLERFERNVTSLRDGLAGVEDSALGQIWTLRNGERVVLRLPRLAALRSFVVSHLVHHRGQLSVYLRLLDVPLPPMYGPTADER